MEQLERLLELSPNWKDLVSIWRDVCTDMFDLRPGRTCLGFHPDGITTYCSKNFDETDTKRVQAWLTNRSLESYNTRWFKRVHNNVVSNIRLIYFEYILRQIDFV